MSQSDVIDGQRPEARSIGSVADPPTSLTVRVLAEHEWHRLRDIRLSALQDYPAGFLASYDREAAYGEQQWRQEFSRGQWNIMLAGQQAVGLLGVTREEAMPSWECYLEYLWVRPGFRQRGAGSMLLRTVLDGLREAGVRTVWLYILNGNVTAMRLYQRFGFQRTYERQELPDHPAGSEERMKLHLKDPAS
jgi:ribosomal protein S18 acetylase RimI-like enzyme